MKTRFRLVFSLWIITIQLAGQNIEGPKVLDFKKLQSIKETVNTTDIFELVGFIPLETRTESLTQKSHTIVTQNEIFVFSQAQGCILKFDRKGNFIGRIGRRGRGPGEFCCPLPEMIQYFNNNIYLFDITCKKIIKYSTDGKKYHEIFLEGNPSFLISDMLNENCFLLAKSNPFINKSKPFYELLAYNSKGNLTNKFMLNPNSSTRSNSMFPFLFWHFNDELYYKSAYCDTAYRVVGPNKSVAAYVLSPGKNRYESKGTLSLEVSPNAIAFLSVYETSRYLIIDYINNGYKRATYDKKANSFSQIKAFNKQKEDNISESVFLWPLSLIRCESKVPGEYVSYIEPSVLKGINTSSLKTGSELIKTELTKLQKIIDENDNPVLVIMKERIKN